MIKKRKFLRKILIIYLFFTSIIFSLNKFPDEKELHRAFSVSAGIGLFEVAKIKFQYQISNKMAIGIKSGFHLLGLVGGKGFGATLALYLSERKANKILGVNTILVEYSNINPGSGNENQMHCIESLIGYENLDFHMLGVNKYVGFAFYQYNNAKGEFRGAIYFSFKIAINFNF